MMKSFSEADLELLIFILHNIGLQIRKEDPAAIMTFYEMAESNKNSYHVQMKMEGKKEDGGKARKINFLMMELQDIKNNKGAVTL